MLLLETFLRNMAKIQCSIGMLTFNSGTTLRRALESVKDFDDIVVCDGGSTDDTLTIAREYGARIIAQNSECKNENGSLRDFACAKNQLIDEARHPYLLILDSDEMASAELVDELWRIVEKGVEDGYRIPIRMWWKGKMIEYAANYPGYQYRIVRTDRDVRMVKPVHERPRFSRPLDMTKTTLNAPWYVYLDEDFVYNYMKRNGKYAQRELEVFGRVSLRRWLGVMVLKNLRSIAGIVLKTFWYRVRYPRAVHMPLLVEWGRVQYHFLLITHAAKQICRI